MAFWIDPQNDSQSVELGYLRLFPTEAVASSHVGYDDDDDDDAKIKGSLNPTSSNVDNDDAHDDDDDHNPKRQLIPTSSQVKSGPIPSLYIQQRPPGGRPRPALLFKRNSLFKVSSALFLT